LIQIKTLCGSAAAHPGNRLSQSRNSKTQAAQQLVSGVPRRRFSAQRALARALTAMLIAPESLAALADLPGRWIDAVHDRRPPKTLEPGPGSDRFSSGNQLGSSPSQSPTRRPERRGRCSRRRKLQDRTGYLIQETAHRGQGYDEEMQGQK
jgi:hypothetical protein